MSDFQLSPSGHLNTAVELPDVASWELSERTNSWINFLWLRNQTVRQLSSSIECNSGYNAVDREESNYARVKFRSLPDPAVGDLRKICRLLDERECLTTRPVVLYNGHSVGQNSPTVASFWLNDDRYSGSKVEVKVKEVQEWLGIEAIYVYDCDFAGKFLVDCEPDSRNIHLAGCSQGEHLPENTRKDLFSCVISNPVRAAFEWHCTAASRSMMLPGDLCDRQMLFGQLDWILTLILDAIAFNVLPGELYQELFRGDLLVATIFRRFILAGRMLQRFGCHPVSKPTLPDCTGSKLWALWDRAMDRTVELLRAQDERKCPLIEEFFHCVLTQFDPEFLPLISQALTLSNHRMLAVDITERFWKLFPADQHLLGQTLEQIAQLLHSKDASIFSSTISCLTCVLSGNTTLAKFVLPAAADINICAKLANKADADLLRKALFLQKLIGSSDPKHLKSLMDTCITLSNHPVSEIRMWAILLMSTWVKESSPDVRTTVERLLDDPAPKVRAAALETWIAANQEPSQKDCLANRILLMIATNSNSFLRKELIHALNEIAFGRTQEMVAACKQETTKPVDQVKGKNKSKSKQKKAVQPTKSSSETVMSKLWRVINGLKTDPDSEIACTMQSLATFIQRKASGTESVGKKSKKSAAKESQKLTLPKWESLFERFSASVNLNTAGEKKTRDDVNNNCSTLLNGTAPRNPTLAPIDHQLRSIMTQRSPEMVRFGSQQQLAIAFKDRVAWQDYTEHICYILKPAGTTGDSSTTVTSIEFDLSSAFSSLLVGYSDGAIRVWNSSVGFGAPSLTSAWQALYNNPDSIQPAKAGHVLMTKFDRTLVAAGDARYLRMWDLEKEMMMGDIVSGTDQAASVIVSSRNRNVAVGSADGTIRLFDLRASGVSGGKATLAPKHSKSIRQISLRENDVTMVSTCLGGAFNVIDMRKLTAPVKTWTADSPVVDVSIHDQLGLVACAGDVINVYSIDGEQLYQVDRNGAEGGVICGAKKRPPSCVAFHPSEMLMCAGYNDNTAMLYVSQAIAGK